MERFTRLAPPDDSPAQTADNTFRFVFSNQAVGRDGHVVLNRGIETANYLRNPVILFCHDDKAPPIGRGSNIDTSGPSARIDVTFVPRDVLPFAGTIRDLVAGKWLRALSMSWQPLEWQYSQDRSRAGGIDFAKVDLLEVSVVPLPALPDALLDARAHGVNTEPLCDWAQRALDTRCHRGVTRPQLEAVYRAARMPVPLHRRRTPEDRARAERRARLERLREIHAQGERMSRAALLRTGKAAHYAGVDRAELEGAA